MAKSEADRLVEASKLNSGVETKRSASSGGKGSALIYCPCSACTPSDASFCL